MKLNLIKTSIILSIFLSNISFSASSLEETNSKLTNLTGTIQSINEELSKQNARIGSLKADVEAMTYENSQFKKNILNEIKALRRQNQSMIDSLFTGNTVKGKDSSMSDIKPIKNYDLETADGKFFLGEDEFFYIKEANATFDARIDTGATTSSISAKDVTSFERKGKKWYRFTIEANDRKIVVEAPYSRHAHIRQAAKHETVERAIVLLTVKVGDHTTTSEFSLTDRTKLQYPVLIGRSLIKDIAVVDVSRNHIQGKPKDMGLLILSRSDYEEAKKKGINLNKEFDEAQKSKAGEIATPANEVNLGTNSDITLPPVNQKISENKDKK